MHNQRPVFLNLLQIRLPWPGIASIMHRVSGALMVLAIPLLAWLLHYSLADADSYARVTDLLQQSLSIKLLLALLLWALCHHLLAGIRYLLIDVEIGCDRRAARLSSQLVIASAPLLALLLTGVLL